MVAVCKNKLKIKEIYCNMLGYYYLSKEVGLLFKKEVKHFLQASF